MKYIKVGNKMAQVDNKLFEKISKYKWRLHNSGYAISGGAYNSVYMHRLILNAGNGYVVDHIDGNKLNNTLKNLRLCSHRENMRNMKISKNSKTGYKGVSFRKDIGKYRAYIVYNYKQISLGIFDNPKSAAIAYNLKALDIFGKFANLNIIK